MTTRLIQITDSHLFADPHARLKEVCTRTRFDAVLAALRPARETVDRLIITGDLTHDDRLDTYQALRELLADWLPVVRVLPGNHDDRAAMRAVFGASESSLSDRHVFADDFGGWRLIGLDSQLTGYTQGRLDHPQLIWLEQLLSTAPDAPTALFVHHPPVGVGSLWLDRIGLEDAADFQALLRRWPQIRVVCTGHVHQELTSGVGRAVVLTTPATGLQFRPETETLVVDSVFPGYRLLELEPDGAFRTRVVRVPC